MSNETLKIKYFQIGDYPVIATGRDVEDVKEYLVKNNWPQELLKDIENGKCEEVDPNHVWQCM
jgi:hypothetical protein